MLIFNWDLNGRRCFHYQCRKAPNTRAFLACWWVCTFCQKQHLTALCAWIMYLCICIFILYYPVRIGRCCLDETVITVGNLHPIIMFTRIIKPLISIGFCQFIVARHKLCNIPQVILSWPPCVILCPVGEELLDRLRPSFKFTPIWIFMAVWRGLERDFCWFATWFSDK